MAQLTVPIVFDHDDLQRMVDEKIAEVKTQFIPKADYENRLKADMVAMLTEIKLEIEEESWGKRLEGLEKAVDMVDVDMIIQQKINALKEAADDQSGAG